MADNSDCEAALRLAAAASLALGATLPPTNYHPPDRQAGMASVPGALSASTKQASYDSGDEIIYEEKADRAMYGCGSKSIPGPAYFSHILPC